MPRNSSGKVRKKQQEYQRPSDDSSYWTGGGFGTSASVPEILARVSVN